MVIKCNLDDILEKNFQTRFAIIILNTRILINATIFEKLWTQATVRILADGGTDQLFTFMEENQLVLKKESINDTIIGDFDSVNKRYFNDLKMNVIHVEDQDQTDFQKSLKYLLQMIKDQQIIVDDIVTIQENIGRFDHVISNVHVSHLMNEELGSIHLYVISERQCYWLLPKDTKHEFYASSTLLSSIWCALIPFCGPVLLTTTGLKWNLTNEQLEFGVFISTSNALSHSNIITIETNAPIIWSFGIEH